MVKIDREIAVHDQTNILPPKKLIVVFCAMSSALFISFIDQNGLAVALPTIGKDLHASNSISWAGTSSLIASTTFQVLFGRLSDIFGRKRVMLAMMGLMCLSQLSCALCRNAVQLYVFRAFDGVATGGVMSLTMMVVSDIVTLENRGKYQGILGAFVGGGNAVGPFIAASFVHRGDWRGFFYFLCPSSAFMSLFIYFFVPDNRPKEKAWVSFKKIDFWGVSTSSSALILLLVPLSGGGNLYSWNSPLVISMMSIGGVIFLLFVFVEWKISRLPMMPIRLFTNLSVAIILWQNLLFGIAYYSNLYFLPIFYQVCRGWSPIRSATLVLPLVLTQSLVSTACGQIISRTKRYGYVIYFGFTMWFFGVGLQLLFNLNIHVKWIVLILIVQGIGIGCVFQPTLVAVQAHCLKKDRAVVISVRNFMRSVGGAVGLAVSSAIISNVLMSRLSGLNIGLSNHQLATLKKSIYSNPDLSSYTYNEQHEIIKCFMDAIHSVFICNTPLLGVSWISCWAIRDKGLQRPDELQSTNSKNNNNLTKEATVTRPEPEVNLSEHDKEEEDIEMVVHNQSLNLSFSSVEIERNQEDRKNDKDSNLCSNTDIKNTESL